MVDSPGVARASVRPQNTTARWRRGEQVLSAGAQAILAVKDPRGRRKMPERCSRHYEALCSASSARTCATTAGLSTFPVGFTGSGSVWNRHHVGTAKDATRVRTCASIAADADRSSTTTTAATSSPRSGCDRPKTTASRTPGAASSACSTAAGATFSPPLMIKSLRSTSDPDVAVLVDAAEIARAEPALVIDRRCGRPVVAGHLRRRANEDLSVRRAGTVDDLDLGERQRASTRAWTLDGVGVRRSCRLAAVLGQAIPGRDARVDARQPATNSLLKRRRATERHRASPPAGCAGSCRWTSGCSSTLEIIVGTAAQRVIFHCSINANASPGSKRPAGKHERVADRQAPHHRLRAANVKQRTGVQRHVSRRARPPDAGASASCEATSAGWRGGRDARAPRPSAARKCRT